jgi:hypothetical protein
VSAASSQYRQQNEFVKSVRGSSWFSNVGRGGPGFLCGGASPPLTVVCLVRTVAGMPGRGHDQVLPNADR